MKKSQKRVCRISLLLLLKLTSLTHTKLLGFFGGVEGYFYVDDQQYLLLPPARTGWIEIENQSDSVVEFGSQKRKDFKVEHCVRLRPGNTEIYNYSGYWCLRLLRGRAEDINILGHGTDQFSAKVEKETGNKLHMV
jgi:hypothetical protein